MKQKRNNKTAGVVKRALSILLILSTVIPVAAQTSYYTETKTFYENGYAYQCNVERKSVVYLYNADSHFIGQEQVYKQTGKFFGEATELEFKEET